MTEQTNEAFFVIPHNNHQPVNTRQQVESMEKAFRQLLESVLRKGYYGSAGVQLTIQDGIIQTISYRNEQTQRCASRT